LRSQNAVQVLVQQDLRQRLKYVCHSRVLMNRETKKCRPSALVLGLAKIAG
jgi:hypothetical protein